MSNIAHLAAQSAREIQQAQAVVTHNLANSGTTGFKADLYQAQSSYLNAVADGTATSGSNGSALDYSAGAIAQTGRDLDVAITGDGWFQVVANDGTLALSRRGDLRVDTDGILKDATGKTIMGNAGPVSLPPYSSLSIGTDGTISIVPMGELPTNIVALDRLMLVNPPVEQLVKSADGMVRVDDMNRLEPDANVRVAVGALETSNVSPVGAMVEMITLARSFEQHIQTIKSAEELDASSASIMKLE
ncbi:flagellar basal body rod protein FlgF [Luminiphilus sp. nBUS_16]|uniref:flagellar basal body rod protein FlgF n=1 Tax=Luminiphilus sp. nBUS_16 TaxID=3395315 RepID=UPI003EB92098